MTHELLVARVDALTDRLRTMHADNLVDEDIDALSMLDQVVALRGIPGEQD